jgi:hypothetical protein
MAATVRLKQEYAPQTRHIFGHTFPAGKDVEVSEQVARRFIGSPAFEVSLNKIAPEEALKIPAPDKNIDEPEVINQALEEEVPVKKTRRKVKKKKEG